MQGKKLSKRLERVADFVPEGARLLDVGSDHAYLPIYLVEQGKIARAIAGEVVQGPFQSAQKNVAEHGLEQQIEVRLANGLAAFEASDQIDCIVIAGMGGRLIADILQAGRDKLATVSRLVLQPNNREDELRAWLVENDFALVEEEILTEAGKTYEILCVVQGQQVLTKQEKRFGPYLLKQDSPVFQEKWQRERRKLEEALAKIPLKNQTERQVLAEKIAEIKEVLHVSE